MTPSELPQVVLAKLFQMQNHVDYCARAASEAERACAAQRSELNDRRPASMKRGQWDLAAEQAKLVTLQQQHDGFKQIAATEAGILKRCRSWLEGLPTCGLEPVTSAVGENTLASVRARLNAIAAELAALQRVPLPDPQLRQRIERYVADLAYGARPEIQGVGQGQTLRILWPGEAAVSRRNLAGFNDFTANALLMAALLEPARLVDRLMAAANEVADALVPAAERPTRIQALQDELLPLRYLEEVLICKALAAGEAAARDSTAPVEAVLQVKIRDPKPTKPALREAAQLPQSELAEVSP
jgi:hypothetical protein